MLQGEPAASFFDPAAAGRWTGATLGRSLSSRLNPQHQLTTNLPRGRKTHINTTQAVPAASSPT